MTYKKEIFLVLFFDVFLAVQLCLDIFFKIRVIENIFTKDNSELNINFITILSLYIIKYILVLIKRYVVIKTEKNYSYSVYNNVVKKSYSLDFVSFQNNFETLEKSRSFFSLFIKNYEAYTPLINITGLLMLVFYFTNIKITGILLIITGLVFLLNRLGGKKIENFWSNYMKNMRRTNYLSDVLMKRDYAYERKIFKNDDFYREKFLNSFDESVEINKKSGYNRFRVQISLELILLVSSLVSYFYFTELSKNGDISVATYTGMITSISVLFMNIIMFASKYQSTREYRKLKEKINTLLNTKEASKENITNDNIVLKNISFTYSNGTKVIDDINFTFEKGKNYGLVGINGAGKSTFANLLSGLYNQQYEGEAMLSNTSVIFQETPIYNISIKEYILLGNTKEFSNDEIYDVLNKLSLKEKVKSLLYGLETKLTLYEKDGVMLSGGQMQKLSIARAILSDKEFIVLDEPTASLDPISEKSIFNLCKEIFAEKTILLITHRLGAVSSMDEVLLLNNNKIEEYGKHDTLMKNKGMYYKLYSTQRSMYVK